MLAAAREAVHHPARTYDAAARKANIRRSINLSAGAIPAWAWPRVATDGSSGLLSAPGTASSRNGGGMAAWLRLAGRREALVCHTAPILIALVHPRPATNPPRPSLARSSPANLCPCRPRWPGP